MARLNYSMVSSVLWTMTIADRDKIAAGALSAADAGGNIDQAHVDVINKVLASDPAVVVAILNAQDAFNKIIARGNQTADLWTGTDCFLQLGQINKIASLEEEALQVELEDAVTNEAAVNAATAGSHT